MTRTSFSIILYASLVLYFIGCKEEPGEIDVLSDQDYGLTFIDTTTLKTFTVLLDSVPTSNTGVLLVGKYNDEKLGTLESQTFFQVGIGKTILTLKPGAKYDSIALIMSYSGYYYGDTTLNQSITATEITDDFKTFNLSRFWIDEQLYSYFSVDADNRSEADKLYNTSTINVKTEALGSTTFKARPNAYADTIRIKLDSALGQTWFNYAKENSAIIKSTSEFVKKFKGISIKSTAESNVIGFDPSKVNVRLYYREPTKNPVTDVNELKNKHYDFVFVKRTPDPAKLYNPSNNYNRINAIRTGDLNLTSQNKKVLTENISFIQAGAGLATKIEFPFLKTVKNFPGFLKINSAKLIIEPITNTYNGKTYLPKSLTMFYTNNSNLPLKKISADFNNRTYQSATLSTGAKPSYTFYLTQFTQSLLDNKETDFENLGVMLTASDSIIGSSITRACVGGSKHPTQRARLEIRYLKQN